MSGKIALFAIFISIAPVVVKSDTEEVAGSYFEIKVKAEIRGIKVYSRSFCRNLETCILTIDNLQFTYLLAKSAYSVDIYEANGTVSLQTKAGTKNFFLPLHMDSLSFRLFSTADGDLRDVGWIVIAR